MSQKSSNYPSVIRVVQYNLLSPPLATPDHFIKCTEKALDPEARWTQIEKKLSAEINPTSQTSNPPAIFCLQEICMDWIGRLQTFFQPYSYNFVYRLYGRKQNGYMGVGIAYPSDRYELKECHLVQIGDEIPKKPESEKSKEPVETSYYDYLKTIGSYLSPLSYYPLSSLSKATSNYLWPKVKEDDYWDWSRKKWNSLIFLKLTDHYHLSDPLATDPSAVTFCVANYHMPCSFRHPPVMILHTAQAVKTAQTLAGDLPLILAGDWNIKPDSPCYQLVTKGKLPAETQTEQGETVPVTLPASSTSPPLTLWNPEEFPRGPMASAYALADSNGQEPKYTNYALSRWNENGQPFIETLDYIFLSTEPKQWRVDDVLSLPTEPASEVFETPLPTKEEPSDHLMLAVNLVLEDLPVKVV